MTVAVLGVLQISSEAGNDVTAGRVQHLARLSTAAVKLAQDLEDERDLTGAYVARGQAGPVPVTLASARRATDTAASAVRADAAGVGAGYQLGTVEHLDTLLASIDDLGTVRKELSSPALSASQVIRVYTDNFIGPADTFSAVAGGGTGDASLQRTVTTLAALLRVENEQSVQRAILYAALSAQPPVLVPDDRISLLQADPVIGDEHGRLPFFYGPFFFLLVLHPKQRREGGDVVRCRLASPVPPPATALNVSAGPMKLSVYTRMTCNTDKAGDDSSLRFPRSSMLASRVSRCWTVSSWYPAPTKAAVCPHGAGRCRRRPCGHWPG